MDAVNEFGELGVVEALDPGPGHGRPTVALPLSQLINLSAYWLGLTAIWAGLDATILPARVQEITGTKDVGTALGIVTSAGVIMPIIVQPMMGAISDYTTTRWGRRKPYVAIGATLDVLFLIALASSNTLAAIGLFYVLLQFSSNFAQGPFQGYLPDLVPAGQVARASGLMGLMILLGQVGGVVIGTIGLALPGTPGEKMFLPTIGLGLIEFTTALVLLLRVSPGPPGLPRSGRSWLSIAFSAWGRDALQQHSFIWLVASRLFFLAGTGGILRFALFYLQRVYGMDDATAGLYFDIALFAIAAPTVITVIPAAHLSDRVGRKPLIYVACLLGFVGLGVAALSPSIWLAIAALAFVGVGAGAFLAVDWALMTDIIPKKTPGRYMGISNLGTAMAGPVATLIGGRVMDAVAPTNLAASPRAAYLVCVLFFVAAAICLRPVDPTPRD